MPQQPLPPWLARALGPGPIAGACAAGLLLWLPSHDLGVALVTAILMFGLVGGLRAADPYLQPLWDLLGRIPPVVRYVAAFVLPVLFSISRFQPGAAGHEVATARVALLISTLLAYLLMRPQRGAVRRGTP